MKNWDRHSLCAVLTALLLLVAGTLYPPAPRAAWWGTTFQIMCEQSAAQSETGREELEFRLAIADLWNSLWG